MSVLPLSGLLGRSPAPPEVEPEAAPEPPPAPPELGRPEAPTGVRFVDDESVSALLESAERYGFLAVAAPAARPHDRGKLALVLEEAIESALERRGACPPGVGAAGDLEDSLGDQLYRARLIELRGICVTVGSLGAIATLGGALDAEDSAVLRWWIHAARTRPVLLGLSPRDRTLDVYGAPTPLETLLLAEPTPTGEAAPSMDPEVRASSEAMELSEPPPSVRIAEPPSDTLPAPADHTDDHDDSDIDEAVAAAVAAVAAVTDATSATADEPSLVGELTDAIVEGLSVPEFEPATESAFAQTEAATTIESASLEAAPDPAPVSVEPPSAPLEPTAGDDWPRWVSELRAAEGPKPLAVIERMFVKSYVPLRDAMLRGLAPESEVGPVLDAWATSFATSYEAAFDALRLRGKRPTMVLDVPDVAHRIGRLHGARAVQLLLVDGLRFDLGLRVEAELRAELRNEVALTERLILWSGLPTDTRTQLELIGRGPAGLADFSGPPESEVPVARGRMARTPRRIKAGHRELLKLDLVEAALSEPGAAEAARLDALGREVAGCVRDVMETLPHRTLLFVFGDHGFWLASQGGGSSALRQGGAQPEEVLVPGFAWLVGGVQ